MHRTFDRILLALIILVAAFSLITMWPSEPWHYLPGAIPWPEGQGIKIPFVKMDGTEMQGATLERRAMSLGLDLKGGTRLVLEPDLSNSPDVNLDDALNNASQIIERRINEFGVAESEIQRQGNRLAVQLPGITAEEAMQKIGKTALLEFRELKTDANGNVAIMVNGQETFVPRSSVTGIDDAVWIPAVATTRDGQSVPLTGQYLTNTFLTADPSGAPVVQFRFNDEGGHLFEQISGRLIGQPLAFFLDGEPIRDQSGQINAPIVKSQIGKEGIIENIPLDDATYLVKLLKAGAFPVPLKVVQSENVDATLGQDSVQKSVIAGETAMLVIMLFMVLYYRLPGLIASRGALGVRDDRAGGLQAVAGHTDPLRHCRFRPVGGHGGGRQHPHIRTHEGRTAYRT